MMTSDTNACGLHITETSKGWGEPDKENAPVVSDGGAHGSPGWTRTNNQVINSHLLCQLSYRGVLCEETYPSSAEVSIIAE